MKLIQVLLVLLLLVALAIAAFFAYSGQSWGPEPIPTDEATFTYTIGEPRELTDLRDRVASVEDEGVVEAATKQFIDRYGSVAVEERFDRYYSIVSDRLMLLETISSWYGSPLNDDQFEIACADRPGVYEALLFTGRLELRWEADPVTHGSLSVGEYPQDNAICYRWVEGDYIADADADTNWHLIEWLDPKDANGRVFGTPELAAATYTPDGLWLSFEDEGWLEFAGRHADGRRLAVIVDDTVVAFVAGTAAQGLTIETGWHPEIHWGEGHLLAQILEQKLWYPDDVTLEVRYGMDDESGPDEGWGNEAWGNEDTPPDDMPHNDMPHNDMPHDDMPPNMPEDMPEAPNEAPRNSE